MHARLQAYALTPTLARAAWPLSVRRTALPGSGAESKRSYNDTAYNSLVSTRAKHILQLLPSGNILYTDIDTVWLHDPIPYLWSPPVGGSSSATEVDMWLQIDEETLEATKAAQMGLPPLADYYCTGFMALRSNQRTVTLMEAWDAALQGEGTGRFRTSELRPRARQRTPVLAPPLARDPPPPRRPRLHSQAPTQSADLQSAAVS